MAPAVFILLLAADVFPHQTHGKLNLKCTFCHTGAETKTNSGIPEWKTCKTCHVDKAELTLTANRRYKLADWVFFSHARHAAAKVECATCHGDVKTASMPDKRAVTSMNACVTCHRESKATLVCNSCHELAQ
ncbi:MAG: cytochrome c3 family protein [Acidobacteria bacterium]|nr:cytochrome c3 family protein [Acidobacteriota bacterium]